MKRSLLLITFFCTCYLASVAQTDYTLVMDRIRAEQLAAAGNITTLDNNVTSTLATLQTNGSWPDISYAYSSTTYTADTHINRVKSFVLAYSYTSSTHYHSATLFDAITRALQYWDTADPQSWNWYHNQISNPQRLGEILIVLYTAPLSLPTTLRDNLLAQMNRGNPAAQTGANKLDIALHFIYRACLTANATLMNTGVTEAFQPIVLTTGEGIQPDLSYQQHGPQLYLYGYGSVFVDGEVKAATYLNGTAWALSGTKLALFSDFVRNAYLKVMRARYIDFSVNGRSISRNNNLAQGSTATLTKLKALDPANLAEYDAQIARNNGSQPPSYMVTPLHTHFWHSDYTVHHRPGYFFGLRNVSPRTTKSENGNGENLKGYYLSEGATNITVSGMEYHNIFPVWDWSRIPGTTVPFITSFPLRTAWGVNFGTAAFSGGVSDSLYGATALAFNDYNTQARKSWFFFDNEIVCLGADVKSTAAQAINTTVNQCLQNGTVTVFANGAQSTAGTGSFNYNNTLKWVSHNGIGYYFPSGGNIQLSNQAQSGTWQSINTGGTTATQTMNVFKLWIDHGTAPTNGSYAYYILPGQNMATYDTTQVRIQSNTADVQAVRHMGLNIRQIVFYKAGTFTKDSVTITVDRACAVMLKNVGSTNVTVSVADPAQSSSPVNVYLDLPNIPQTRHLTANLPSGNLAGSSVAYTVNLSTPVYEPPTAIPAIADAFVRNGTYATTNYGTATSLVIKKDAAGYARETFFKFDVSGLPSGADQVKMRLYVNYANTGIAAVPWIAQYVSNDSWTETGINWNNMPIVTSNIDTATGMAAGNYVEWDVTGVALAQQSADGILSVKVVSNATGSTTDASFSSKETGTASLRPSLVYTAGSLLFSKLQPVMQESPASGTKIFPVPAGTFVRVQTDQVYDKAELHDVSGRVLKVEKLEGKQQFEINLQQVPPGVYMLQLSGPKGKELRKVVKM
ncbi:polysaccharide lyase family 8 super-sandwich domain-containing protein [Chitinophaga barathri]|uniref:DNRLRE domain-containing protein n=1 Tax=Chitinophaga barathri TaxID=1647451 RepID=A0A3N4N5P1_9BACT|nr:polysaccharide lyase family 8 super-sandwich domain-containing protein [Chitinophaga barathri]RPD42943.1 DNRLRE domain-containing protein [Chitinophaga barathri]